MIDTAPLVAWEVGVAEGQPAWLLKVTNRTAATVWMNGVWHTWDQFGHGGENWSERTIDGKPDVTRAKKEAAASAIAQGFI